jgi:glyoxylase-like metal-dependent hydrolase (beta-lactamase superfamily II)
MRPDAAINFWEGETLKIADGVTLIRCGGHFAGGTVLHWQQSGGGRGALMGGDIVMVVPDRNYVSFMWSFPNLVPLSGPAVEKIGATLEPFEFETIYGPFFDRDIRNGAKNAVRRSVKRYVDAINHAGIADRL